MSRDGNTFKSQGNSYLSLSRVKNLIDNTTRSELDLIFFLVENGQTRKIRRAVLNKQFISRYQFSNSKLSSERRTLFSERSNIFIRKVGRESRGLRGARLQPTRIQRSCRLPPGHIKTLGSSPTRDYATSIEPLVCALNSRDRHGTIPRRYPLRRETSSSETLIINLVKHN